MHWSAFPLRTWHGVVLRRHGGRQYVLFKAPKSQEMVRKTAHSMASKFEEHRFRTLMFSLTISSSRKLGHPCAMLLACQVLKSRPSGARNSGLPHTLSWKVFGPEGVWGGDGCRVSKIRGKRPLGDVLLFGASHCFQTAELHVFLSSGTCQRDGGKDGVSGEGSSESDG